MFTRSLTLAVGATTLLGGVLLPATAASAAEDVITVTSLGLESAPATGETLRSALEEANASTNPDGVRIEFAEELAGTGALEVSGGNANSMSTTDMTDPGSENGTAGARFVVDSQVPVSIDFTNLDGIVDLEDLSFKAGIYVASDNVSLSNLENLRSVESGIVIGGDGTTVDNVNVTDNDTNWQEVGVLLIDGAANTSLTNMQLQSALWGNIVVDNNATVTNTVIRDVQSRGVESWGHIVIEDAAVVTDFEVSNSTFGAADEISAKHGFFINPNVALDGLAVTDSTFQSPGADAVYFYFGGQTLKNTTFTGNTFGGNADEAKAISRVIDNNSADWDGLNFSNNTVENAGAVVFNGTLANATFDGNTFTNVKDPAYAALQLTDASNVDVTNNAFDHIWALDSIRVQGTTATDVVIENNVLENLTADVSRSAVLITAPGSDNFVRNNTMVQDLDDATLPAHADNHWAVYVTAYAADAASTTGWSILDNEIDGFGGRDRSAAPIVHDGLGKLLVTGNTFGLNTRGDVTTETEHNHFWFLANENDGNTNNGVQTFRPEIVRYNGTNVTFTAVQPDNLIGNNSATAPVTLHVYWTSADNAEEYLGEITDVTPGEIVSIPTTHTDGFVRVQTVDANGYTSQYSSIDEDTAVVPAAPVVTETTETGAIGTGQAGATVTILDEHGEVVATAVVGEDGSWSLTEGLTCDSQYFVYQTADGIESETVPFTTADCAVTPPTDGGDADGGDADGGNTGGNGGTEGTDGSLATTGGADLSGLAVGALIVLLLGGSMAMFARRRRA